MADQKLKNRLIDLNYAYETGELSITQRLGIITLLPKGDKPKQFLKNWRPNKLASALIAEGIKNILLDLINDDQKGFMKGRYIGENVRKSYVNNPACYCLDFEKAFDSVSHTFIFKTLHFLNF